MQLWWIEYLKICCIVESVATVEANMYLENDVIATCATFPCFEHFYNWGSSRDHHSPDRSQEETVHSIPAVATRWRFLPIHPYWWLGPSPSSLWHSDGKFIYPHTVLTFNFCTRCLGSPCITHDRTLDCHPVSRRWMHGWPHCARLIFLTCYP